MSSNNLDSPAQMRGWFKLMETIRKTDPPPHEVMQSPSESSTTASIHINGHLSKSPETSYFDNFSSESPNLMSSPSLIDFVTTPIQTVDETPAVKIEPTIKAAVPKRSSTRHKKITIRKSSRSKISLTAPDDEIPATDTQQRRQPSMVSSLNNSTNPIATDLQSLPGHDSDETRDQRFLSYSDTNTLTMHLNRCLCIDKKSSSSYSTKPHIFKTRHNILSKIFKLDYLKNSPKVNGKSVFNKHDDEEESKNDRVSSTYISFKTDWSVNRRSSSTHSHDPKNIFHILQLHPKKGVFLTASTEPSKILSIEDQQNQSSEHIKNLLIRTYYPHFHSAVQSGSYFGSKSKISNNYRNVPMTANSESSTNMEETMTITLQSPPSTIGHESKKRGRKPKYKHVKDKPLPLASAARRVSEEIPAVYIGESPKRTSSPLIEKAMNNSPNTRKRKISITARANTSDIKKRPFIASPSPELITDYPDVTYSDDEEDILPDQLPISNFINNGLRSNYYKLLTDPDSKSASHKARPTRRVQQVSSGSLPPFYTGIFESDDEKLGYIDYKLPFDIYWFHQKQGTIVITPSKPAYQCEEKKLIKTKQKQSLPYKKPTRYVDVSVRQSVSSSDTKEKTVNINMEELTEQEKRIVSETSILLKRNLRRIKERRELKDKNNNNQQKQHLDEQPLPLFFSQNFYHSNEIIDEASHSNLSHKDLLNLFSNHIRRSHFYKSGQCFVKLVDRTCYYAQLAQLTLILNEMFDLLLNYKCQNSEIYPSNALKKCPLKRLFPMYYELILKPIDLTIIRNKLDNGEYLSFNLFEQDLLLLFDNAITYCGEDSDVGRAVRELRVYLTDILVKEYRSTLDFFGDMNEGDSNGGSSKIFEDFIKDFHRTEVVDGQIREVVYEILFNIDGDVAPIVYRTIQTNSTNTHRSSKSTPINDCIIHCRCGSTYDETALVQCYACQLWQHVACVTISHASRPYFCFECHPLCEENPRSCLKMNVEIPLVATSGEDYSTITRSDGLIVRVNECYLIRKQDEQTPSSKYDLFFIERLWRDEHHLGQASGFYYLRPDETFHEVNRKFFPNEVFRFPSTNDSIEINAIIQPCYVLDATTFCKGKPVSEYTSRVLPMDLFICEYRVDKLARTFTRLPKSKHIGMNTKSYCFDHYVEKLSIKRDFQPHQQHQTPRRRSTIHPTKLSAKQLEEKSSHIDGIIEKIYCHFHHPNLIPSDTKFSPNQFLQQQRVDRNNNRGDKRLRDKPRSSTIIIRKKPRTRSPSSHDKHMEYSSDNHRHIVALVLEELIESLSSHLV